MGDEETTQVTNELSSRRRTEDWGRLNTRYLKHFRASLSHFTQHLDGLDNLNGNPQASFLPPNAYWTTADKSRFFHALSVHSRLRPDLIAAEIPGKTVVDVCAYLQLLSEASAGNSHRLRRNAFTPVLEVSDEWVEFEECQAEILAIEEPIWDQEFREDRRASVLQDKRLALLKQKDDLMEEVSDKEARMLRKQVVINFQEEQEAEWRKEDYMAHLSGTHLRVIDNILRETEEPHKDMDTGTPVATERASSNEPGSAIANEVIDPFLLAISYPQTVTAGVLAVDTPGTVANNGGLVMNDKDLSNLSPRSRRRFKKRLHMRRKRAEAKGDVALKSVAKLKPGRKRNKKDPIAAQMDGDDTLLPMPMSQPAVGLEQAMYNLNPQDQEEKDLYLHVHGGKEEFEVDLKDDFLDDAADGGPQLPRASDEDGPLSHTNIGGLTLPYKIKQELVDLGYDANRLTTSGLGLFHLSNFDRLRKLQSSLCDASIDAASCISAETLKQLSAEVVCFVVETMQRTVAIHEQQRRLKSQSKVWRLSENQIAASTVEDALATMGVARNKKRHFRDMLRRLSSTINIDPSHIEQIDEEDQSDDYSEDEVSNPDSESLGISSGTLSLGSIFREIHSPFVWDEPYAYSQASSRHTLHMTADDMSESEESADANALVDELLEEDELDQQDLKMAEQAETELWAKYTGKEPSPTLSANLGSDSQARALRFGQPPGVKSRTYIEDSD